MRWGHDFLRIRGGVGIQTFGPMGKSQMSKGEPIKLSITHFVFCAQSFNSARNWLGYLIKVHIYMMSKLICVVYHDIPSATISIVEHNTTKSMVGLFPLAPHHD